MSHVVTVDLKVYDIDCLKKACERLGASLYQRRHKWYGHWVDDSPVPREMFGTDYEYEKVLAMNKDERKIFMTNLLNSSEYAIKFPQYDYEIGVHKIKDYWSLSLDWYGDIEELRDNNPIPQAYAVEKVKKEAANNGWCYTEETLENGKVVVELNRW